MRAHITRAVYHVEGLVAMASVCVAGSGASRSADSSDDHQVVSVLCRL